MLDNTNGENFSQSYSAECQKTDCLWCGSEAIFRTKQKGYKEPNVFKIFHCANCDTSFSLPRVMPDEIYELIYKNAKEIRGYCRYTVYQDKVLNESNPLRYLVDSEPNYWGVVFALERILKINKTARILEIGSGLGYLTYALRKDGYDIQGLDISNEAVNAAKEKFGNFYLCHDLLDFGDQNKESYDVVIMTEVIEHLNSPHDFIVAMKKLLRSKGTCILTTPNKSFYPANIDWFTDAPPVHCWWLSEKSIEYLANSYNFQLEFVKFNEYYKRNPELYTIKDLNSEGAAVFNSAGDIISNQYTVKKKNKMPKWIKRSRAYLLFRNCILQIINPDKYKVGHEQSNVMCALLTKP